MYQIFNYLYIKKITLFIILSILSGEFLNKVSSFAILFNKDAETKQKIKAFEHICFVIYSGERDKYQDKLIILLEKMGEVIRNAETAHPSLLILVSLSSL